MIKNAWAVWKGGIKDGGGTLRAECAADIDQAHGE